MNLKSILVAGFMLVAGCYLPPETDPRVEAQIVYVYEPRRYQDDYYYWSREYALRHSPLVIMNHTPIQELRGRRIEPRRELPRREPQRHEQRRTEPPKQDPHRKP